MLTNVSGGAGNVDLTDLETHTTHLQRDACKRFVNYTMNFRGRRSDEIREDRRQPSTAHPKACPVSPMSRSHICLPTRLFSTRAMRAFSFDSFDNATTYTTLRARAV